MSAAQASRRRAVLVAAGAALFVALLGATVTDLGPWYHALRKPDWQPPDPAFGIIWTAIFALTAASGVVTWRTARESGERDWLLGLYALNGFFNVFWSLLFFRLHRPDWALVEVGALWLSIVALIIFSARHARLAGVLLTPYLIWVSVASVLNFDVVRMNAPFG